MFSFARMPLRTGVRVLGLAVLVTAAVVATTAQEPDAPALPTCDQLDALRIPMQMNLRASAAMQACGRGGELEWEAGATRDSLVGSNVDAITGAEVIAHPTQSEHQIWVNGSQVVINYNDSRTAPTNYSGVSYSTDGGVTYTRLNPSPFASGHGTNFGDPTVVFSKAANKWTATDLATGCGGQGIGMWTSTDGGATWATGACVHSGSNDDRQSHAVDNNIASPFYGYQYVSWNNFNLAGSTLQVTKSTDGGFTWSAPVTLTAASFRRDVQIQVALDGTVLVAAMDEGGGGFANRTNYMYRSTDGGATFSAAIAMGGAFAAAGDALVPTNTYFAMVNPIWRHMGWGDLATGSNSVVIYSYCADGAGADTGDVYLVRSTDNGVTWGAPLRVDGATGTRTQWMPSTAGGQRNFLVSWYDRRNTANNDYERWGVISRDGGVTWSLPRKISDMIIPQPAQPDTSVQPYYAGDYMRSFYDQATQTFYDGWTDGRITVSGTNQQDVETQKFKANALYDRDGEARTDLTLWRPSTGVWYSFFSGGGAIAVGWGVSTDIDVAGDYDGDGKLDFAVFRPSSGTWLILRSKDGGVTVDSWGVSGDIPVPGDYDGDGKADLVVFRPSNGVWFIKKSTGGTFATGWGISGDVPMMEDFAGDGTDEITIYRPSTGVWYILFPGGGAIQQGWGIAGDIPVMGDWDGDSKADIGIFRPSSGTWLILRTNGGGTIVATWGASGDIPVAGDWDADGRSDFGVFRASSGVWFVQYAGGGSFGVGWGINGDKPVGRQPGS